RLAVAPASAWLASRFPRARLPLEVLFVLAVSDGLRHRVDVPVGRTAVAAVLIVALAVVTRVAWRARSMLPAGARHLTVAGVVATVAAAALAVGYSTQRDFNRG